MKVAAVVVTYNRLNLLKKTLEALFSQSRKLDLIVVVNNGSTDGTGEYLKELSGSRPDMVVLHLKENLGGSGGFYEGLRYVYCERVYDWIWMMDDDAVPERDALRKLLDAYESLSDREKHSVGVLECQMISDFSAAPPRGFKLKSKLFGMFVGYLLRTSVIDEVGLPRKDFFIYYDDTEYTFRIRGRGYKVFEVLGSYIYHRDWARSNRIRRFPFSKPDIPPWKVYYIYRNGFLMFKNWFVKSALFVYFSIDLLIWMYVKPEVVKMAIKGLKDGIKGISGKVVSPERG